MCKKFKHLFIIFYTTLICFGSQLTALPSTELYWERVAEGLRWHREHSGCAYLTEDRLSNIEPIVNAISEKEKEFQETHYQVLTAQDSKFIAYQVILKELYKLKYDQNFDDYEFLRPYNDPEARKDLWQFLSEHPDLIEVERLEKESEGLDKDESYKFWKNVENDTHPEISKQLISASLTLETMSPLDSAQFVFASGSGMSQRGEFKSLAKFLIDAFAAEEIHSEQVEEVINELFEKAPLSKEGIVLQIFIPKEEMYSLAYVSYGGGFLKREETSDFEYYFISHEMKRDSAGFIPNDNDQVRVLAGGLDPSTIKIFRYSTVSDDRIKAYEELVRQKLQNLLDNTP